MYHCVYSDRDYGFLFKLSLVMIERPPITISHHGILAGASEQLPSNRCCASLRLCTSRTTQVWHSVVICRRRTTGVDKWLIKGWRMIEKCLSNWFSLAAQIKISVPKDTVRDRLDDGSCHPGSWKRSTASDSVSWNGLLLMNELLFGSGSGSGRSGP